MPAAPALTVEVSSFAPQFPDSWLPRAPLAGDVKAGTGLKRHKREVALTLPHIESNPSALRSLIVTDHDAGDAEHIAGRVGLPPPSYVAVNPHTKGGHIVYALRTPVILTDSARRRPANWLAAIEHGMCEALDGDTGYSGRVTKNPFHEMHLPLWGNANALYSLKELSDSLSEIGSLPKYGRSTVTKSSVGRNCALFDLTRRWSYRAWERYALGAETDWLEVVHAYAWDRNLSVIGEEFTRGPLDEQDVVHLARSVGRWTWRRFHQQGGLEEYRRRFKEKQAARGKRGGAVVSDKKREANRVRATKVDLTALFERG